MFAFAGTQLAMRTDIRMTTLIFIVRGIYLILMISAMWLCEQAPSRLLGTQAHRQQVLAETFLGFVCLGILLTLRLA
jgi:hypothetical protein